MSGLQRKQLAVELKADRPRSAVGDAMIFGIVDRDFEITVAGALGDVTVAVIAGHDWSRLPVGAAEIRSDPRRARAAITFLGTAAGEDAYRTVKELLALGVPQALSIGFIVEKARAPNEDERQRGARRVLEKITVVELSLVVAAAVPGAAISGVKHSGAVEQADVQQAFRDLRRTLDRASTLRERSGATLKGPVDDALIARGRLALGMMEAVVVDGERQGWAERSATWAAARWRIHPPAVKWFHPSSAPGFRGVFHEWDPAAIWLSSALKGGHEILEASLHETSHRGRFLWGMPNAEADVDRDTAALLRQVREEVPCSRMF